MNIKTDISGQNRDSNLLPQRLALYSIVFEHQRTLSRLGLNPSKTRSWLGLGIGGLVSITTKQDTVIN